MLSSIFLISSCDNCGRSISKRVAELALSHRIPAICTFREFAYDLMAYFADEAEMYRDAAVLVDKVLKGARPAELPVEQPTKFALVINRKTAKAPDLQVPDKLLAVADEVNPVRNRGSCGGAVEVNSFYLRRCAKDF